MNAGALTSCLVTLNWFLCLRKRESGAGDAAGGLSGSEGGRRPRIAARIEATQVD